MCYAFAYVCAASAASPASDTQRVALPQRRRRFAPRAAAFGGRSSAVDGCGDAVEAAEAAEAAKA